MSVGCDTNISEHDFIRLVNFVKAGYGIDLEGKQFIVQSRLANYVADCGFRNFSEYLEAVFDDNSGREVANLINRLTTNHTYFMRESEHFDHFREVFLPQAEKAVKDHDLRIWSAGCSFGNEPYNLAMCLDEYFGFRQHDWDLKILATDISFNALRSAARGVYTENALHDLPEEWRRKYFEQRSHGLYQVKESLRSKVIFKYHNLMEEIGFKKKFDLILCRNVMIYFDDDTKSHLCRRFYDVTEDGGYLYIGHAESAPADMPYVKQKPAIYRKEVSGK
ncbi:CheR family methyltransferase [Ruminococcus albus]|uniref:protein-glutamate O-methyltransferase n=1 Tax=Ruminococcus albus 8 TaxID=246199 RepID=E9S9C5_RUMAL|nr:protein-glutamate O-methyltransferase CheR [Ruminococcus albus]EGC04069.1 methyltransferase CheR, SAM binding domain protein [Ruminococcus albus 8]MCC3350717.1 protein-glutamate O-methyltransferase CheR [Ruminococcus albus 8]